MPENIAYCHRVEERTVIPGKKIRPKKVGFGVTDPQEINKAFVIIKATTEKIIGRKGSIYDWTYKIPIDDFFFDKGDAVNSAIDLHFSVGCKSSTCGWLEVDK